MELWCNRVNYEMLALRASTETSARFSEIPATISPIEPIFFLSLLNKTQTSFMYHSFNGIMKKIILFTFALLFAGMLAGRDSEPLVFSPHWMPQAQFAGFYVAYDQGFYEEEGVEVEIIHPSPTVSSIDFLERGTADVITQFLMTALTARDQGSELVNIGQVSQHSAIMLVSKAESGIESINDIHGKKVGVWRGGFRELPMAMLSDFDIEVEWVPLLWSVNLFLEDGVDLMTVMWYNEYNQLYLSGLDRDEINTFFASDYGFDVPEDGIYTLPDIREKRAEDLSAFVRASMRGWTYAAKNQEYTVDLVVQMMREANIPGNKAHQRWMLERMIDLQDIAEKGVRLTELHPDDYSLAVTILRDRDAIGRAVSYEAFFQPVYVFDE